MPYYRNRSDSITPIVILIIGIVGVIIYTGGRIVEHINYSRNCSAYLKRASDANTVELANKELSRAISYIESHKLTSGYTSVVYNTPDEDLGFWYDNLKASQKELEQLDPEATQLEKTNVLMKLRETILDDGEGGPSVTEPSGISVFPYNVLYAWLCIISILMFIIGFIWTGINSD